jgi:hypothetical protein
MFLEMINLKDIIDLMCNKRTLRSSFKERIEKYDFRYRFSVSYY